MTNTEHPVILARIRSTFLALETQMGQLPPQQDEAQPPQQSPTQRAESDLAGDGHSSEKAAELVEDMINGLLDYLQNLVGGAVAVQMER
ncbi:hypothetical protein HDV00_007047 [Rhizophlyctis rosea]|nr:hypothetical protein HDV00_007047 [Rhizophlyctis rosea]